MQSVWLLLATLTISCLLFVPIVTSTAGSIEYHIVASGLYQKTGTTTSLVEGFTPLLISTIVVALLCFANIFNFKKRAMQKRIIFVTMILIISLSFWCSQYANKIPGGLESANFSIGTFLPLIAIICCLLAIRGINNDEKLIRSADRLR